MTRISPLISLKTIKQTIINQNSKVTLSELIKKELSEKAHLKEVHINLLCKVRRSLRKSYL